MANFLIALNAVAPFLAYMLFGLFVRRTGIADDAFLRKLNQLIFKAFFPITMFYNMYHRQRGLSVNPKLMIAGVLSIFVILSLSLLIVPRLVEDNGKRGSIIQAIYRSNSVLFAAPLMANLYGDEGASLATMLIAIVVPIYNITAVILLEYYGNSGKNSSIGSLLKNVLTNPLIDGAIVGLLFFALRIPLPEFVERPVAAFANVTTPLALFVLGGTLQFKSLVHNLKYLLPTLAVKLLLLPGLILAAATLLGLPPLERFLLFCITGTPVATASYAMAQNMGCDGDLAGEFVVLSTSASVFTIFFWIYLMSSMGML